MSVGRWLDDATGRAVQAAAVVVRDGIPVNDLLAVFYARDRAWMALARMADLLRGARAPKPVSLAAATGQQTDRAATPIRLIAVGAHAAVLRQRTAADVRLAASGLAARLIIDSADAIAVAADILATHVEPRTEHERALRLRPTGNPAAQALADNRHLTMVGAGLAAGVERERATGELARLAHALVGVDRVLVRVPATALTYLGRAEAEQLRRWTSGPFPALFADHLDTAPAVLLREIEPATTVERSTGPRPIGSFADVVRTVTDISSVIQRDPQQLTARLLNAIARIGFGTEVLAGRLAGDDEPSPRTISRAAPWREVAVALTAVRDAGDAQFPTYAREANAAADWIRDHARRWPDSAPAVPDSLEPLQRLLGGLAAQSIQPWRHALRDGRILTAAPDGLSTSRHKGIRHSQVRWGQAPPLDPQGRAVLHRLADTAATAHPTWTTAARAQAHRIRSEEAIAGHGPYVSRLQDRRQALRLAVQAHAETAQAQQAAARTHASLQVLRGEAHYTPDRPRTAAQKTVRQQVDALERELARQQQQWEITRATAQQLAHAAGVPDGHDPREILQQISDDWGAAIETAVADDIQAAARDRETPTPNGPCAPEHVTPSDAYNGRGASANDDGRRTGSAPCHRAADAAQPNHAQQDGTEITL